MEDSDLDDSAQEVDIGPIARAQVGDAPLMCSLQWWALPSLRARLPPCTQCCLPAQALAHSALLPPTIPLCPQVRRALKSIAMKQQKLQLTAEAQAQRSSHSFS